MAEHENGHYTEFTVAEALKAGKKAYTVGHRLILPFHCEFISMTIGLSLSTLSSPDVITDFSMTDKQVTLEEGDYFTDVYFSDYRNLSKEFGRHKGHIILVCCELHDDLFNEANHIRLKLAFRDDSRFVSIKKAEA